MFPPAGEYVYYNFDPVSVHAARYMRSYLKSHNDQANVFLQRAFEDDNDQRFVVMYFLSEKYLPHEQLMQDILERAEAEKKTGRVLSYLYCMRHLFNNQREFEYAINKYLWQLYVDSIHTPDPLGDNMQRLIGNIFADYMLFYLRSEDESGTTTYPEE